MIGDLLRAPSRERGIQAALSDGRPEGCASVRPSLRDEAGQGLVEYSLVILLVVLLAIPALQIIGVSVTDFLSDAAQQI